MRLFTNAPVLAAAAIGLPLAAVNAAAPVQAAAPATPAPKVQFTTADTEIGALLDNPGARAILNKYLPDVTHSDQIDMARTMTLRAIQSYAADQITDAKLAQIDVELARLN